MRLTMAITNERRASLDLMYLAHANFRPVDGAHLSYSAPYDAAHVRVRQEIPSHINPPPGYTDLIQRLAVDPALHHRMSPDLAYDPEAVFMVDYRADGEGLAHSLQILPDGSADYIAHRPAELPYVIRWLSRTPDQDCLGLALPATAGVLGFAAEKAAGRIVAVPSGATWSMGLTFGALAPPEAARLAAHIDATAGRPHP
jgi:hypothetical protein